MIGTILKLVLAFFSAWVTQDKRKREAKLEALNYVIKAIKEKSSTDITIGFDRIKRL